MILLNPGPVNLSPGVRQALTAPDLCHREPEFAELQSSIRRRLLEVYHLLPAHWAAVLLTGSGTAAVEAMITSLIPRDGRLLVVENGAYGERMSNIARIHRIEHRALRRGWGDAIATRELVESLDKQPAISHVALVHHETTTGRLNRLAEIGALCRARGVDVLVDAVSSFGAEALDFEAWGIVACAATANKCLHGAPGVSFVVAQRSAIFAASQVPRTLYLDLATYCREQDSHGTPFTQSVPVFYALAQALKELADEEGGWRQRRRHYTELVRRVRQGLADLGIRPLLAEEESSVALSAYHLPEGLGYAELHDGLKERGFVIYAGQGEFARRIFRVSTLGAITREDIERFLLAFEEILNDAHARPPLA